MIKKEHRMSWHDVAKEAIRAEFEKHRFGRALMCDIGRIFESWTALGVMRCCPRSGLTPGEALKLMQNGSEFRTPFGVFRIESKS